MPTYFVGEDQHRVDHPPLFAARQGRRLLTLSESFVNDLLMTAEDRVPVHLDEIASKLSKQSAPIFQLPHFLLPPKIVLYNPDNHRGVTALPGVIVLINSTFFGIPAVYLTHTCFAEIEHDPPPLEPPPSSTDSDRLPQTEAGRPRPSGRHPQRPGPGETQVAHRPSTSRRPGPGETQTMRRVRPGRRPTRGRRGPPRRGRRTGPQRRGPPRR